MRILEEILLEFGFAGSVSVDDITNAVTNMLPAKIVYDDGEDAGGKGERTIYPVAYGISTAGNPSIRAFQTGGSTRRGAPQWKLLTAGKIKSWNTISGEKYNPNELVGFNADGDKQMEIIYSIAPIGNAKDVEISKSKNMPSELSSEPITKGDIAKSTIPQDVQFKKSDDNNYTANDAINDILSTSKNVFKKGDIDKNDDESYFNKKLEAPKTEPVKSKDIPGGDNNVEGETDGNDLNSPSTVTNEPITKSELEKSDDNENELKSSFDDMMKRMDNLNKDEENEEN